jgi:hypothetical protein
MAPMKTKTIFDPCYDKLISELVRIRHEKGFTQRSFAAKTGYSTCFIGRTETKERRLDLIETIDYMKHLGLSKAEIVQKITELV